MRRLYWFLILPAVLLSFSCGGGGGGIVGVGEEEGDGVTPTAATPAAHYQDRDCASCHTDWNLVAMHDASSPDHNGDCILCHGDKTDETTLDEGVQAIHSLMSPYVYQAAAQQTINNDVCIYCHQSVDLLGKSAGALRRQVSAADSCVACHQLAGPGKQFYE